MWIEKKTEKDFEKILALTLVRTDQDGMAASFYWPQEIMLSELYMTDGFVLYDENQQVLAFVIYRNYGFEFEISSLTTAVGYEGRGLMTSLLSHLLATKPQGVKVFLEVHHKNKRAQRLYENLGFIKISERPNYYKDRGAAYVYLAQ